MGWIVRAAGAGALVGAVCAGPSAVGELAGALGASDSAIVAETAGAERRAELARHLAVVDRLLAGELSRTYAGTWVDEPAGGVAVVAATAAVPERLRTAVRALLPAGAEVEYRLVQP